jgi:uncharacterized membrane-anchored protein
MLEQGELKPETKPEIKNNKSEKRNPSETIMLLGTAILCFGGLIALVMFIVAFQDMGPTIMDAIIVTVGCGFSGWSLIIASRVVKLNEDRNELLEQILQRLDD